MSKGENKQQTEYQYLQKRAKQLGLKRVVGVSKDDLRVYVKNNAKQPPNPTGKGGFGDNPENINYGGRPKNEDSFTYWLNFFKSLTVEEFKSWERDIPEEDRTVVASIAYARMNAARSSLKEFKEVADRTEGKAPQSLDLTSNGQTLGEFNDDQIRRIAARLNGSSGSNGKTPSKEKSN